jgi:hypothetical protein
MNSEGWQPDIPDPTDPGADPRDVDRVWLADVWHTIINDARTPAISEHNLLGFRADVIDDESEYHTSYSKQSHTLALLRAARAAGVPEVVEAMGDEV